MKAMTKPEGLIQKRVGTREFNKRALDIVLSILFIVSLLPLLLLLALAIRLDSDGPIIYRQFRAGRFGKEFKLLKFRTMRIISPDSLGTYLQQAVSGNQPSFAFKISVDPRLTRVGRFLRRTSLDELPQLWNVLLGDMSIVGPRPVSPYELERYTKDRILVRPGITGLEQVMGNTTAEDSAELAATYVKKHSIFMDLEILGRFIVVILRGSGAY
jgi:undecaprenyl-phosphate galactose phosphotransferase